MGKRLPFHIQHNTNPKVVVKTVRLAMDSDLSPERLSVELGYSKGATEKVIVPFLCKMEVLDGLRLSEFGERLRLLAQHGPDLLAEAMHVHLYTLHWTQPNTYFSFAYATICNWLWERGEWKLDSRSVAHLVSVVVDAAEQTYGVEAN